MADQAPDDEVDTQPVIEHLSDICNNVSQDHENIHNPHEDNEEDTTHCKNKDFSGQECTDQINTRLDNEIKSGKYNDNEDTKKNNATLQAEIKSTMTSSCSDTDEYEDVTGQDATLISNDFRLHTEIKNKVSEGSQTMSRLVPEHSQADCSLKTINTANETSQTAEPSQEGGTKETQREESALSVCKVESTSNSSNFTVVLFGNTSAVHIGDENILLGAEHVPSDQAHIPRKINVSGRALSVVNILDLHEGDLYLDHVDHITGQLVNENNIQAFIFVLKLGQFTDDDKMGLEWLQRKFGNHVHSFVMILFTYEREEECDTIIDDLKNNTVLEQLIKKCGDRYCTCSKSMNNQSEMRTLLEKIDQLVSENNQCCYTAEIYSTALQIKDPQNDRRRQKHATPSETQPDHATSSTTTFKTPATPSETQPAADHSTHLPQEKKVIGFSEEQTEKGKERMTESGEDISKYEENKKLEIDKKMKMFSRLNLTEKHKQKMKTSDVLQITSHSLHWKEACTENDLVETFLQRLLMMDYDARYITSKEEFTDSDHSCLKKGDEEGVDMIAELFSKKAESFNVESHKYPVHPMDVQMAVFHCSDHFLKQLIVTKLSQCQYALPLLVPNPFTREIEFPLWTFRQIRKSWKITDSSGKEISKTQAISEAKTPMVAFFRFGSVSSSKSQLMNSLINEKHHTFFHRHCPGSSKNRLLMDGVVEIAWYCPSGKETDYFSDCVAFCNLHGDAETNKEQLEILTEKSSVNVVLLSDEENITNKDLLEKLLKGLKPLICLLSDDESGVTKFRNGNYRIGLKDRNQSDISKNLRVTIKECLSKSTRIFKLRDFDTKVIIKDEDFPECIETKEAAVKMLSQLEGNELSKLKEKYLPCQGKLWHDWCEINKDLYQLHGNNLEMQKSTKQKQMNQIREQQHKQGLSSLMQHFISTLKSLGDNNDQQAFFLKWVGILLDKRTSNDLSALYHKYNEKWTTVLDLKKKHDKSDKMKEEQKELEELSEKLNAATFGLEHILREMGQIYESFIYVQTPKNKPEEKTLNSFPELAAELMKSGYPVELMDGDAAHVPLIWVSAVLDELVKILGDQRVFVLSVLGIQSSGKSTMLNAMFGLQFAVSAGRCTRGAFMQLVRVSEEMKKELNFDYILVVDTEGLRALELAGKSTQHHDNELATFVVGLGNLTLINIFGENPAEMQDILQIVVQAFLRMKKVRLNPSCLFVHQNVSDITAGEKNMEGRRRLQEKLDEMTKLAAKEEDSEAECFSDVIEFNVQDDVYYFAQLWVGSPPTAPPNPCYSRNVQNLKNAIFKKAKTSTCMTLSQFKCRISDLWNALLNENFVFSFKNTLEIAVYRKLETEFGKWTWTLRSAMIDTEEKLHNRIENKKMEKIEENDLYSDMKKTKEEVNKSMKSYFEEDKEKEILIQWKVKCENKITQLYEDLIEEAKRKLNEVLQHQHAQETFERKSKEHSEKLFSLSKELALSQKIKETNEQDLKQEFDKVWDNWVTELTQDTHTEKSTEFWDVAVQILSEGNERAFVYERKTQEVYKNIDTLGDYSCYIILKKNEEPLDESKHRTISDVKNNKNNEKNKARRFFQRSVHAVASLLGNRKSENEQSESKYFHTEENDLIRTLIINVINETEDLITKNCKKISRHGHKGSYIQEITDHVRKKVEQHHNVNQRIKLTKEFTLDLCLHVCECASHRFTENHKLFREANDPRVYLSKQKPQYYRVFKNYCRGATTTTVFGELICSNLRDSILQAVYNHTAIDLVAQIRSDMPEFNGNRSKLEKHILKCLAEEENFEKYMKYIHNPRDHFKHFITEKVNEYISDNDTKVLNLFKGNLKDKEQRVKNAVHIATEEVKKSRDGDADMWLRSFTRSLKDELSLKEISFTDHKEITDFDFLQQVIIDDLTEMISELHKSFNSVEDIKMEKCRKKPDEILIEHLCRCCWVQCPFCNAICTNTMEDHDGDHSVPFHRVDGINGWHRTGTSHLCSQFCTTAVQSNTHFYPKNDADKTVPYKSYRKAGGVYATWSITPDNSQLAYWKWFVCRFQTDLEKNYGKRFEGHGEIPREWRECTKQKAVKSLDENI